MTNGVKLSVKEILQKKVFDQAQVIAGKSGLNRNVRWVHVLEVASIENLLNGNELILSTGVGWGGDIKTFSSIVQQSIDSNAAGLCIEMGRYIFEIPQEVIQLADTHHFPIIIFKNEVRFMDITQEIHSLLIKKNYQILSDLEDYSNRLNQLLLSSNSQQRILQLLHDHLKMTVFYRTNQGKVHVISKKTSAEKDKLSQLLKDNNMSKHMNIAHQSIQAMDQTFADLFIISESETITEYESLILDRSATALAQSLLRELYVEEQRKAKEAEWVGRWLEGKQSDESINRYLLDLEPSLKTNGCTVLLCKEDNLDEIIPEFTYLLVYLRSIFEKRGIFLLSHVQNNQFAFILINQWKTDDFKRRIEEGIECLRKSEFMKKLRGSKLFIGVGKIVKRLGLIESSYHTAKETLKFREKMSNKLRSYFYEDLYIFRLVLIADDKGVLKEFISDYLGPILSYDQKKNGELLKTLNIYLQCKGSKTETAEQLHIVRQTLYHRLDKIYELIGNDFMESYKRQAIEVAISAYEYMSEPVSDLSYQYQTVP